jgi:hypothetical protein
MPSIYTDDPIVAPMVLPHGDFRITGARRHGPAGIIVRFNAAAPPTSQSRLKAFVGLSGGKLSARVTPLAHGDVEPTHATVPGTTSIVHPSA